MKNSRVYEVTIRAVVTVPDYGTGAPGTPADFADLTGLDAVFGDVYVIGVEVEDRLLADLDEVAT